MRGRRVGALLAAAVVTGAAGVVATRGSDASAPLPADAVADAIVVRKSDRTLTLLRDGQPLKSYEVALGRGEPGAKRREGDNRTPVGAYAISGRNPQSAYHLSLRISYPDPADIASAASRGEPPGGDIKIHGLPNGLGWVGALHRFADWTAGCVAVTDGEIEEIWTAVPDGTPITILP